MKQIIINVCEDGDIWVTSDDNQIGKDYHFEQTKELPTQLLVALADFVGYDPTTVLDYDVLGLDIDVIDI